MSACNGSEQEKIDKTRMPSLWSRLQERYWSHVKRLEMYNLYHQWRKWSALGSVRPTPEPSGKVQSRRICLPTEPAETVFRLRQAFDLTEKRHLWMNFISNRAGGCERELLDYLESCVFKEQTNWDGEDEELVWAAQWQPADETVRTRLLTLWKEQWRNINNTETEICPKKEAVIWSALIGLEDDEAALVKLATPRLERQWAAMTGTENHDGDGEMSLLDKVSMLSREVEDDGQKWNYFIPIPVTLAKWRPRSTDASRQLYQWWEKFLEKPWRFRQGTLAERQWYASRQELWEALFALRECDARFVKTLEQGWRLETEPGAKAWMVDALEGCLAERKRPFDEKELEASVQCLRQKVLEKMNWQGLETASRLQLARMAYVLSGTDGEKDEVLTVLRRHPLVPSPFSRMKDEETDGMMKLGRLVTGIQSANERQKEWSAHCQWIWEVLESEIEKYGTGSDNNYYFTGMLKMLRDMAEQYPAAGLTNRLWEKKLCLIQSVKSHGPLFAVMCMGIDLADEKKPEARPMLWNALCQAELASRTDRRSQEIERQVLQIGKWEMVMRRTWRVLEAGPPEGKHFDEYGLIRLLRVNMHLFPDEKPDSIWSEIWESCRESLEKSLGESVRGEPVTAERETARATRTGKNLEESKKPERKDNRPGTVQKPGEPEITRECFSVLPPFSRKMEIPSAPVQYPDVRDRSM